MIKFTSHWIVNYYFVCKIIFYQHLGDGWWEFPSLTHTQSNAQLYDYRETKDKRAHSPKWWHVPVIQLLWAPSHCSPSVSALHSLTDVGHSIPDWFNTWFTLVYFNLHRYLWGVPDAGTEGIQDLGTRTIVSFQVLHPSKAVFVGTTYPNMPKGCPISTTPLHVVRN